MCDPVDGPEFRVWYGCGLVDLVATGMWPLLLDSGNLSVDGPLVMVWVVMAEDLWLRWLCPDGDDVDGS